MLLSLPVLAETESKVSLNVSAPDSSGKIEAVLKAFDIDFQAFDAVISYNKDVVAPDLNYIKENFGQTANSADGTSLDVNLLSLVKATADSEKGLLFISGMTNLSQPVPNKNVSENYAVSADNNGVTLASISFNKIKDGDAKICFATKNAENFAESVPNGVTMAQGGRELPFTAEVKTEKQEDFISYFVEGTKTPEDNLTKRTERIKDTLILQIGNYAATKDGVLCHIDPLNKNVVPFTLNDRTLIPLRFIAESLGLKVSWQEETQTVTLSSSDTELIFIIGENSYSKGGVSYPLDCPATLNEARTFVPLRAVAEAFQKDVCWIESKSCIVISPLDNPWNTENITEKELLNDALIIMSPFVRDMI
ncbi:MAG: copper amine oxidase N-terminal domain-containing protein [Clostridia bacterium]|nr:copper amine oxidase N-terminal domain-containing protein [Clostridia bacterium]